MKTLTFYLILLIVIAGCSSSEIVNIDDNIAEDSSTEKTHEQFIQTAEYKKYKTTVENLESFKIFNDDFISRYRDYLSLKQQFGNTPDTNIIKDLNKIKGYVFLPYKYQDLKEIELKYLDTLNDPEFREKIYVELFEKSISSGNIEEVLKYDRILQSNNFEIVDNNYLNRIEQIKNISTELKELETNSLHDDEYLFTKANLYFKLNLLGRWMECHVLDVTSSTNYYMELIDKYPSSKYRINAKLAILGYSKDYTSNNIEPFNYFRFDNGMASIEDYESLLEQTDDIEQRSQIYFVIAKKFSSCEICFDDSTAITITKKYLKKIVLENPTFDRINEVEKMLTNFEK